VLFASDLHLSAAQPTKVELALALLDALPGHFDALFLLGDLVEFWPGDDDDDPVHRALVDALRGLTARGVAVSVMTGNRDFLMRERFRMETGVTLLPDWAKASLHGKDMLLTHGDLLCLKDLQYQAFRRQVREPARQQQFLSLPLSERRRIAGATRVGTMQSMAAKDDFIMDVDEDEVLRVLRAGGANCLVHGHTHRPAIHTVTFDGRAARRVVLGDWYGTCEVYAVTPEGARLQPAAALLAALL
jgi:UDP-2,3-diacylglucosamine hydrolase